MEGEVRETTSKKTGSRGAKTRKNLPHTPRAHRNLDSRAAERIKDMRSTGWTAGPVIFAKNRRLKKNAGTLPERERRAVQNPSTVQTASARGKGSARGWAEMTHRSSSRDLNKDTYVRRKSGKDPCPHQKTRRKTKVGRKGKGRTWQPQPRKNENMGTRRDSRSLFFGTVTTTPKTQGKLVYSKCQNAYPHRKKATGGGRGLIRSLRRAHKLERTKGGTDDNRDRGKPKLLVGRIRSPRRPEAGEKEAL